MPTCQQLSQLLEEKTQACRRLESALAEVEQRYGSLVDNIPDVVYSMDEFGNFTNLNRSVHAYGYTRQELVGQSFLVLVHPDDRDDMAQLYMSIVAERKDVIRTQRFRLVTKTGDLRWFEANYAIRFRPDGTFLLQEGVARDVTDIVDNQITLMERRELLEEQVKMRTRELVAVNQVLQKEILDRRETERRLREREVDLQMEKANLQEANTALKVLLKRREVDKRELEEQILYNVKELVSPFLDKLGAMVDDDRLHAYLTIAQANLNDITSSFSRRLALEFYGLTASELRIANFIRQGKRSRDIAHMLALSERTVEAYRQSIRNKLRIKNKKVNLRTFLLSIE